MSNQVAPAIECENLSFAYKQEDISYQILNKFNLKVPRGKMVAIQGPSGSGKSTLLYLIGGMLNPDSGHVKIDNHPITSLSHFEKCLFRSKKIGFIFQQFYLLNHATVLQNVIEGGIYPAELNHNRSSLKKEAEKILTNLGLKDCLHKRPLQLSGGQQQRVSIARALMQERDIILADEPTGNLDTKNMALILDIFRELQKQGKTILIITHDPEVAKRCDVVFQFRDGQIVDSLEKNTTDSITINEKKAAEVVFTEQVEDSEYTVTKIKNLSKNQFPYVLNTILQNKFRALLTLVGVSVGIASVLAMITIAEFTKNQVVKSFDKMGANAISLQGYPNWRISASDKVTKRFNEFSMKTDIPNYLKMFPDVKKISPVFHGGGAAVLRAGKELSDDVRVLGLNEQYLSINNIKLISGNNFSKLQVDNMARVCIVGTEIVKKLFLGQSAINQVITVRIDKSLMPCRVIGILANVETAESWNKTEKKVLLPYTILTGMLNGWQKLLHDLVLVVNTQVPTEKFTKASENFFTNKYGKGGNFFVSANGVVLDELKKYLQLFKILLSTIAGLSLFIGGVGLANMMMASLTERVREIGVQKALGASNFSIRTQFLMESLILCFIAGFIGLLMGITCYHILIYFASKVLVNIKFAWTFNFFAIFVSIISILVVGLLSGIIPALKAERLEVIEALRKE